MDTRVLSPVVVGRARELEQLSRALDGTRLGAGQFVVLAGEAGIGKSRILAESREQARGAGFVALEGACFEPDSAFPYAPVVDALRTLFSRRSAAALEDLVGPLAPELVKLVPELSLALPGLVPASTLDPEAEKRRLFETLARFFLGIAERQPLLLSLEDLHWCDDLTLEFLQVFARRLRSHRVLVVASYRPEEAHPALTRTLARLARERLAEEVVLAPLARADVDEMVRAILELPKPVAAAFLEPLVAMTEGNPFAVEETLKGLIDAGELRRVDGQWAAGRVGQLHVPRSVRDAVQRRITRLSAVEREVLTIAAVAGRRFEFGWLREATGLEEADLLGAIEGLVRAQLVVEETADRFGFRHALTREAIYSMVLLRERQALHRRVAEALERAHAADPDRCAADLAYHFHASGSWEPALRHARRAGELAQALHAPRAAVEHFNRALGAAEQLGLPPPADLLLARARALETIGYFEPARADYERVTTAAAAAGDLGTEWTALIGLGRLWASRDYACTGRLFRRALERARALGDQKRVAISLNRLGNWHANVAEPEPALRDHREALGLFETLGDRRGVGETLDLIGMASQIEGRLGSAHEAWERAVAVWRELGDARGLGVTLSSMPLTAPLYLHQLDVPAIGLREAVRAGEGGLRIAREIGWRAGEAYALFNLGMTLGPLGDYGRAFEAASLSLACAEEIEHHQWITAAHAVLGMLHLDVMDLASAVSRLERALERAGAVGSRIWTDSIVGMLALAHREAGRFELAERLLDRALAEGPAMRTQAHRLCWYARAELSLARGDPDGALEIIDRLIRSAQPAAGAEAPVVIPRLWALRGAALARARQPKGAAEALQAARVAADAQELRPLRWRIDGLIGRLRVPGRPRDEARAALAAARSTIQELAAELPDGLARDGFLQRARATLPRARAPSGSQAQKQRFGGLSARQREVAALIAAGGSNREIAERLGVGLRTVETHVTQILMKLGFSSRAQVAAWAVQTGLAETARMVES